ncbi:hypothetical protein V6N12_025588 [Hibiscus sabdariffa]|uniref:CCHC-type domain-containing protein n=1 Tax=Hibiscus sabdariffa TaxID=183260 RepID=A0ABR2CIX8_9ROSI
MVAFNGGNGGLGDVGLWRLDKYLMWTRLGEDGRVDGVLALMVVDGWRLANREREGGERWGKSDWGLIGSIHGIARIVGCVVKVDYNTQAGDRGKFARLTVMVDSNKPLKSCIGIDHFIQKLEYEGLNQLCFKCGIYGHSQEFCSPTDKTKEDPPRDPVEPANIDSDNAKLYGPWMVANSQRRMGRGRLVTNRTDATGMMNSGSRFDVLQEDDMDKEVVKNAAYKSSYLDKRSKDGQSSGVRNNPIKVVSLDTSSNLGSERLSDMNGDGKHTALRISDHGKFAVKAKSGIGGFQVGKIGIDYKSDGVPARSQIGHRQSGALVISDWVQTVSHEINDLVASEGGVAITGIRSMEEDDPGDNRADGVFSVLGMETDDTTAGCGGPVGESL